jgi:hypothetical protein
MNRSSSFLGTTPRWALPTICVGKSFIDQADKLDSRGIHSDGVIGRRFALDLAPLRPSKRTVKEFELDNTSCNDIGSFLVNDILECRAATGPVSDCLTGLKVSSLTKVGISK